MKTRRGFLKLSSVTPFAMAVQGAAFAQEKPASKTQDDKVAAAVRKFLSEGVYTREQVAAFLDTNRPNWATFDPELGYLRRNCVLRDGVDGCRTISSFHQTGERRMMNYAHEPCRLNAYGNSFTEGVQVSDGETWCEYLAAHLGEPMRNFGIGGYGVYQAYRRMLRQEATASGAEHLILNIWGLDDHLRSIDAWRWLRFGSTWRAPGYRQRFHGNPWAFVRLDLKTGKMVEHENPYPTPESLYLLADKEHVQERFSADPVVRLVVAERDGSAADLEEIERLASDLDIAADLRSPDAVSRTARAVHVEYALRTSMQVVEEARTLARQKNKKLMILLSYDSETVRQACEGFPRPDQKFLNFLKDSNVRFVDVLAKHVEDFKCFRLSPREYVDRYFIGHYKPLGNHFFAFAIKDAIVDGLDPKPIAYRMGSETIE